jgi:hypothetical protein
VLNGFYEFEPAPPSSNWLLLYTVVGFAYYLAAHRWVRSVRARLADDTLLLRGLVRTWKVPAANVASLRVEQSPGRTRLVLCDGRILHLAHVQEELMRQFESAVARVQGPEMFVLSGIPASGRVANLLARVPFLSGMVRPVLTIDSDALRLRWLCLKRTVELCRLAHVRATGLGVVVPMTHGEELTLRTYGTLHAKHDLANFEFNQLLSERIVTAQRHAITRALDGYRARLRLAASDDG